MEEIQNAPCSHPLVQMLVACKFRTCIKHLILSKYMSAYRFAMCACCVRKTCNAALRRSYRVGRQARRVHSWLNLAISNYRSHCTMQYRNMDDGSRSPSDLHHTSTHSSNPKYPMPADFGKSESESDQKQKRRFQSRDPKQWQDLHGTV